MFGSPVPSSVPVGAGRGFSEAVEVLVGAPAGLSKCRVLSGARPVGAGRGSTIAHRGGGAAGVPEAVSLSEHQPNKRLELAARCLPGTIPFVINNLVRRSSSASR
jgi:hypothetical protein